MMSGPTIELSRAADRATIKRDGQTKEYMFVNRCGRRRLQRHVGPGHGGRNRSGGVARRGFRDAARTRATHDA